MRKPSLGVVYNAEIRNNGTARRVWDSLCRMGFKDFGLTRYSRPVGDIGKEAHDFWIFIDDGRDEILMDIPEPNACWLVDTHLGYDQRLEWAKSFDHVFLAQKEDVPRMFEDGIDRVYWLPLACHPNVDPCGSELKEEKLIDNLEKTWDFVFAGFVTDRNEVGFNNRVDYLDRLFKEFPNSAFFSGRFFHEAAQRAVKGRGLFNVSIKNDLNMRFFEGMSYGSCLLSNRDQVGWKELGFEEGEHFVGYQGMDEMVDKGKWLLENGVERERIAAEGFKFVRDQHTYRHRVDKLLDTCGVLINKELSSGV